MQSGDDFRAKFKKIAFEICSVWKKGSPMNPKMQHRISISFGQMPVFWVLNVFAAALNRS